MVYTMIIWVTKSLIKDVQNYKSGKQSLPSPWRNNTVPLCTMHPGGGKEREMRKTISCGEMTTSMQIPGRIHRSIYPLTIAVLIFLYAWSALDMSCLLTDPGSLVQTEDTQSVELSVQCLRLVEIMHTVVKSAEGTISLYSSIPLISTPRPICSFT